MVATHLLLAVTGVLTLGWLTERGLANVRGLTEVRHSTRIDARTGSEEDV